MAPGGDELRPRRSQEVRGSSELQNGSLRALEEAWMTTFRLTHFPVKSGRVLCFWGQEQGWPMDVWHGPGQSLEVWGRPLLQNSGLRAPGDACRGGYA